MRCKDNCIHYEATTYNAYPQKDIYVHVAEKIKELRIEKGLNQKDFAKLIKMTRQSVHNLENRVYKINIYKLFKIATLLEIDILKFFPKNQKAYKYL